MQNLDASYGGEVATSDLFNGFKTMHGVYMTSSKHSDVLCGVKTNVEERYIKQSWNRR